MDQFNVIATTPELLPVVSGIPLSYILVQEYRKSERTSVLAYTQWRYHYTTAYTIIYAVQLGNVSCRFTATAEISREGITTITLNKINSKIIH